MSDAARRVAPSGPVIFAYDGSDLAKGAIDEAGSLLGSGRDAIVLTVWQTFDVGFVPAKGNALDAANAAEVRLAAEQTAAEGVARAETAGFQARSTTIEASSPSKAIVAFADEQDATVIVLGSHGRAHLRDRLLSSVAEAVAGHTERSVLIAHCRADGA